MVVEDGSAHASAVWDAPLRVASSVLTYPEGRAALGAARRAGRLSAAAHAHACAEFETLHAELLLVGVDHGLARQAGALAEQHGLRGYDAVHLASALSLGRSATLVSWDQELRAAAADNGLTLAPAQ